MGFLGDLVALMLACIFAPYLFRDLWSFTLIALFLLRSALMPWRKDLGGEIGLLHHTATDGIAVLGFLGTTLAGVLLAFAWPHELSTMIQVLLVLAAVLAAELVLLWPLGLVAWGLRRACGSLEPQVRYVDFVRSLLRMSRGWGLMRG
jgi:hypothetical protein